MKVSARIGVILTLIVLLLGISVGIVSASYGDNLITNPTFSSIGTDSSTYWKYSMEFGGAGGSGTAVSNPDYGVKLTLTAPSGIFGYMYVRSNSKVNLAYVSELKVTNTKVSGNLQGLRAQYSSDGRNWDGLDKITSGDTGEVKWDVSDLNGEYYIGFYVYTYGSTLETVLNSAIATDVSSAPTFVSATTIDSPIEIGGTVSTTVTYAAGMPSSTTVEVDWGDGSSDFKSSGSSFSHTYQSGGYYTVTSKGSNGAYTTNAQSIGVVSVTPKITSVSTVGATFISGAAAVTPGTSVEFIANYNGVANSFTWSIGGTEVQGSYDYVHTFNTVGQYEVKVKATGTAGTSSYYTVGTVYVGTNSVSFDQSSYTQGNTAHITWSLNNPDYADNYNLQIFQSDSTGITSGDSVITPVSISSSAVTSYDWNTAGATGYYVAKIYMGSSYSIAQSSVVSVQTAVTLTVVLTANSVTYTNATTVTLYKNGAQVQQQNTTSGSVVFNNVLSGSYTITAETIGYASQSATITLSESSSITMDFVTGSSAGGASYGGAGGAYSVTYITFRVIDRDTGATVPGAKISGSAFQATNPIEWIVNWFGSAYGNSVIGTNISGYSDDNGVVSFVMYPNLRYQLKLEHTGLSTPSERTFSPSSLSAEYPWYISFPKSEEGTTKNIKTAVNVTDTGYVEAHYQDLTKTTSTVTMQILAKDDDGKYNLTMDTKTGGGNDVTLSTQLSGYSGKDIKIVITAQTTAYGTVTKTYYHTFLGPWLDIGLPHDAYIWICLLVAILLGGVATYVNSYTAGFVICFFEWIFWFFGWFFQVGQWVILPVLIFATVLSVLFYMQSRK